MQEHEMTPNKAVEHYAAKRGEVPAVSKREEDE